MCSESDSAAGGDAGTAAAYVTPTVEVLAWPLATIFVSEEIQIRYQ